MIKQKYFKYLIMPVFSIMIVCVFFAGDVFAQTFTNPIGYTTVDQVLSKVLITIQSIVAILAVLMIVVGGIIYITSAGDQGRVDLAKKAVTAAVIGLALAVAAPTFLKEIYGVLGQSAPSAAPAGKSLSVIIGNALNVLLGLIGTLSVLMLVVGGIMYMTSGGDDTRAETAKNTIKYAIIGLIVAIISLIIVTQVTKLF